MLATMTDTAPLIAVVDDDLSLRRSLCRLLRSSGYRVEVFASAEELLERTHSTSFAGFVLDVRMPGTGGLELQRRLSAACIRAPVIFITGHQDPQAQQEARDAGAVDWLEKPFEDEALLDCLRRAVGRTGGQRHGAS
jgi:FixJ family two-component response regulator